MARLKEKNDSQEMKKQQAKAYEKYVKGFTPKPKYFSNCIKAFFVGGLICLTASYIQGIFISRGFEKVTAGSLVTVLLITSAQLLTGLGLFDSIAKFAGAGVIVPITGFANSMVSPAMEFKKEGPVLGAGAKLFSLAGPVLVWGITISVVIGAISWLVKG